MYNFFFLKQATIFSHLWRQLLLRDPTPPGGELPREKKSRSRVEEAISKQVNYYRLDRVAERKRVRVERLVQLLPISIRHVTTSLKRRWREIAVITSSIDNYPTTFKVQASKGFAKWYRWSYTRGRWEFSFAN